MRSVVREAVVLVVNDEINADTTCLYVYISNITFY